MKTISYIIGYRWNCDEDGRLYNLKITLIWLIRIKSKLKDHDINLVIIIIEQDATPKFNNVNDQIEYLFIYNSGFYNRGWAFNVGYREYTSDYYFFADGDILINEAHAIDIFKTCFEYEAVNPYKHIYDSTEEYIKSNAKIDLSVDFKTMFVERTNTCFSGGIMGISKNAMSLINGWDERFRGRGWEDYAFTSKLELFLYSIHTYPYPALHLWHPWEINTTRDINEKLHSEYETYTFHDYISLIERPVKYGSPTKYAMLTSITSDTERKNRISDNRYQYAKKVFTKLLKKYKNTKNVYLHLCDQLKQVGPIGESGGPRHCPRSILNIRIF